MQTQRSSVARNGVGRKTALGSARVLTSAALAASLVLGLAFSAGHVSPAFAQGAAAAEAEDTLIFRNGNMLRGKIVSETETSIRFRSSVGGKAFEVDYSRDQILEVKRGSASAPATTAPAAPAAPAAPSEPATTAAPAAPAAATPAPTETAAALTEQGDVQRYYWVDLDGEFGVDITQTPIANALRDARQNNANVIIFRIKNKWEADRVTPLPDVAANFDEIFRAEDIVPLLSQENMEKEWGTAPKIVFWVERAMAGAALLPLVAPNIYFSPDGKLGGLGNLSEMFEGVGDESVREKQRSLRMGHAEGWAIRGGYDYRIVPAMARTEVVLSMRYEGDKVVLFNGMPTNPGEVLLTDDGKDGNADTLQDVVRGEGNDVLTLNAETARLLGVSKGTVATREELLIALGLDRAAEDVSGRSPRIMREWAEGLKRSQRQVIRLMQDFGEIQVGGDFGERQRARGQQMAKLREMLGIMDRWGEGMSPRWRFQNNVPQEVQLRELIEQIRLAQLADRR